MLVLAFVKVVWGLAFLLAGLSENGFPFTAEKLCYLYGYVAWHRKYDIHTKLLQAHTSDDLKELLFTAFCLLFFNQGLASR